MRAMIFNSRPIALFLAALLMVNAPLLARADDAAALLAKHKAYAGWSFGDGTFKTLVLEGSAKTIKTGTVQFRFVERTMGATSRTDYTSSRTGLTSHNGFTGSFLWQSSTNGFTTKIVGDPAKAYVAQQIVFYEAATSAPATLQGERSVNGTSYSVVRVKIPESLPVDLYIAPSGAYGRFVVDPGGAFETTYDAIETTEPIPGKKIINSYTIRGTSFSVEKSTANAPIAAADLEPPPATASWSFGKGDPVPIKVTDKRIFVTASVNGVEGHFILDSGASSIVLSNSFAKRAGLENVGSAVAIGIGGTLNVSIKRAKTLTVGDNVLSNVVVRTGEIGLEDGGQDGLLGYDLLGGALVEVNLDDSTLSIYDPAKMQPDTSGGVPVLVDLSTQTPVVPMKLNNRTDVRATLDSGNPLYVLFDRELIAKNGLQFLLDRSSLASNIRVGGVGGYEDVECGKLQSLQLGPISYNGPPACMGQAINGATVSDREVLVGFDLLRHFNILFDYPAALILLAKRAHDPS